MCFYFFTTPSNGYPFVVRDSLLIGWLVGRVLWHINLHRLFNAKLYIYIYICVFNQRFLNEYFVDNVLDKQDLIGFQRIK